MRLRNTLTTLACVGAALVAGHTHAAANGQVACTVLTEELVRDVFSSAGADITLRPSRHSPNPLCMASWPKPDAAELEQLQQQRMQEYFLAKSRGDKEAELQVIKTANEVSLTLNATEYETTASARAAFDAMIEAVSEGVTAEAEVGGKIHRATFTVTYDRRVPGVGDAAAWSSELNQLSVVAGTRIFHVTVDVTDDDLLNLEHASTVARRVAGSL